MTDHVEVRAGLYRDSVALLQVSKSVGAATGVQAAIVAMATPLNLEMVRDLGFTEVEAGPNDLIVAIRADDSEAVGTALGALEDALSAGPTESSTAHEEIPAHTVRAALRRQPDATLVLLSVPGPSVYPEAVDAIEAGRDVLIFSDNVTLEQEVDLKQRGRANGVLVMGPDCGTAILGGLALGFANVVRRGSVGVVAASGTGAQQMSCLLHHGGLGISQLVGVGGRDAGAAVGGSSTRQAMRALANDPDTDRIVVVSKPPDPTVAHELRRLAETISTETGKPVHFALLAADQPDLTAVAEEVLAAAGVLGVTWPIVGRTKRTTTATTLRGLFSGGTLADEAMLIAAGPLGPIRSNTPLSPELALGADLRGDGHVVIDFGDDALTQGRAHPMIDPTLRVDRIAAEADDPTCGVLLVDVVLGHVADPDPAATLAPALARVGVPVVVSLTGTDDDPQGWGRQAAALAAAGAEVYLSNAQATRRAVELLLGGTP